MSSAKCRPFCSGPSVLNGRKTWHTVSKGFVNDKRWEILEQFRYLLSFKNMGITARVGNLWKHMWVRQYAVFLFVPKFHYALIVFNITQKCTQITFLCMSLFVVIYNTGFEVQISVLIQIPNTWLRPEAISTQRFIRPQIPRDAASSEYVKLSPSVGIWTYVCSLQACNGSCIISAWTPLLCQHVSSPSTNLHYLMSIWQQVTSPEGY